MRTAKLTGPALDWAVAKCERFTLYGAEWETEDGRQLPIPSFSTDWAQGGPIIEREGIDLKCDEFYSDNRKWLATTTYEGVGFAELGPAALIAAMRCYVASKLGDEVKIPEELK